MQTDVRHVWTTRRRSLARTVARAGMLAAVVGSVLGRPAPAWTQVVAGAEIPRLFVDVNGGYQAATRDFTDRVSFRLHAEDSTFDAAYRVEPGPLVYLRGGVRAWRQLGVAVAMARYAQRSEASVTARLPHPFFFDRMRQIDGEGTGFQREEIGWYVDAVWLAPLGERVVLQLLGGLSYVELRQDLAERVEFSESYPYDTATFTGLRKTGQKARGPGFSVGVDGSYFFARHVGIGGTVRFVRVRLDLSSPDQEQVAVRGGGIQTSAGLRLRFR